MDKQEWMVTDNDLKKIWDDEQGSPHVETAITFAQKKLLGYLITHTPNFYYFKDDSNYNEMLSKMLKQLEDK